MLPADIGVDAYEITVNVALGSDGDHRGGALLGAYGGAVRAIGPRGEGDATVHSSKLLHGVSAMAGSGVRYSLIVFFDRQGRAAGRWAAADG